MFSRKLLKSLVMVVGFVAFGVAWMKFTRIGGTVFTIHAGRGWGVHSGDFYGWIPLTVWLLSKIVKTVKRNKIA